MESDLVQRSQTVGKITNPARPFFQGRRLGGVGSAQRQRVSPSSPFLFFEQTELEQSIGHRFEQQVDRFPHCLAIQERDEKLTYAELNKAANGIAHAILSLRGQREEPIALLLENHTPVIAALLGVLKSGKAFVPLDPSFPSGRARYLLRDSQASLIVTNNRNLSAARQLAQNELQLVNVDNLEPTCQRENPGLPISPDSLGWILYTSGSTGQPKGVMQTHRNALHFTRNYVNGWRLCQDDRLTLLFSCGVNAGVHNLFIALLNGLPLYPFDINKEGLPCLTDWLIKHQITNCFSVPTVFRHFLNVLNGDRQFPKLRLIQLGGEPVLKRDLEYCRRYFPEDCVLVNRLGSTETGTIRWCFIDRETAFEGNIVPVGYPVEDNEILLLDEDGKEVGFGTIGEIVVRSRYLSPGYWRRPDLTQKVFLPDPEGGDKRLYRTGDLGCMEPDGCLSYLGRKDFQVKVRGYRIETGEIEMALLSIPAIKETVVVARQDRSLDQRLIAYCVPRKNEKLSISELRHSLSETLADYMVPSAFVQLDSLPQTPNGKIDRLALPAPVHTQEDNENYVAPRTPVEETQTKIWEGVLGVPQVGVEDNFFDLGGNSLIAMQILSRTETALGVELSLQDLIQSSTVAQFATLVVERLSGMGDEEELLRLLDKLEGS